jgi:BlaI family penicillinase repressor
MAENKIPQPTPAELAILQVLWKLQPATVRAIHEAVSQERPSAYTTTLKILQIMLEKKLVERDESQRSHTYRAVYSEEEIQRVMAGDLLQRVFKGSAAALVMQALGGRKASRKELEGIRGFLDEMDRKRK